MEKRSETRNSQHYLAIWEVASVVTSCLVAEWVVLAFVGRNKLIVAIPVLLALGLMIISHREYGESAREIGFRTDNFIATLRLLLLPTAAAVVIVLVGAFLTTGSVIHAPWRNRFFALPLWALFQQYVLNGFISRRLQVALGSGAISILLVGIIFGLLHLPNPLLAVVTFIGGVIWAWGYQRKANLWALAISHAIVSITLALTFSGDLLNSLRVGFKYFG
jgi:membrane protease YdiL (CAAX protease family)